MAHLKKWPDVMPNIIMPRKCNQTGPVDVNRFSDGSQIHPQNQAFALAAAGAWTPHDQDHDQHTNDSTITSSGPRNEEHSNSIITSETIDAHDADDHHSRST